jgi:anti-sigma factor RsiW
MPPECDRRLEPELLSGYLDGELFQAEEQRVRIHLEDCAVCRQALAELRQMREATMSTRFEPVPDEQWRETPKGPASRLLRGSGWVLFVLWLIVMGGYAAFQLITAPESLWEKLLVVGGISAVALLFLSVLLDRLHDARSDRYKGVKR